MKIEYLKYKRLKENKMKKKIMIVAGRTGGHILPALEIANFLIKKKWEVAWLNTNNKIESILIPQYQIKKYTIKIEPLKKKIKDLFIFSYHFFCAIKKTCKIIDVIKPHIILGMGSYISAIGCLAGWYKKIPIIIHEQNKIAGLSNRIISKIATEKLQAFSESLKKAKTVGNPIRKNILNLPSPYYRFLGRTGPLRILVLGGSQGSKFLNMITIKIAYILKNKILLWHQTGISNKKKVLECYKKINYKFYKVNKFIIDMYKAYYWADIVICRSGALTVSEISAVGIPAIFIPFEHKDKHQYFNAMQLKKVNAAEIFLQNESITNKIIKKILSWDRSKLLNMAQKSYKICIRNSTEKICNILSKEILKIQ